MPFRMQSSRGMKPAGITKKDTVTFFSEAFPDVECGSGNSLAIAQKIFFVRNGNVRVELYPKLRMGEEVKAFFGANAVHCERN